MNYPIVKVEQILSKWKSPHSLPIFWIFSKSSTIYVKSLLSLFRFIYLIQTKNWSYHWLNIIVGDAVKQIWSYRTITMLQRDLPISCGSISFSKTYVCLERCMFCIGEKDWHNHAKNDDKDSVLMFLHKKSKLFYIWLHVCWRRGVRKGVEGV